MARELTDAQSATKRRKLNALLDRAKEDLRIGKPGAAERVSKHGQALTAHDLKHGRGDGNRP